LLASSTHPAHRVYSARKARALMIRPSQQEDSRSWNSTQHNPVTAPIFLRRLAESSPIR